MNWLKKAYSMEKSIEKVLEAHAKDAENMPDIREKIMTHIEQNRSQAERVKIEIERLGDNVSGVKEGLSELMGMMQGASSDLFNDKIVKNAIAEHATEHF